MVKAARWFADERNATQRCSGTYKCRSPKETRLTTRKNVQHLGKKGASVVQFRSPTQ
jgi:hypothetical protein